MGRYYIDYIPPPPGLSKEEKEAFERRDREFMEEADRWERERDEYYSNLSREFEEDD